MADVLHELRPLPAYLWGTLTLMMRANTHTLRLDEEAAHRLEHAFRNDEPCDSVQTGGFIALDTKQLDAITWLPDSRQPSPETPTDRTLRRRGGPLFSGGWLNALRELAPPGAHYSVSGLQMWRDTASDVLDAGLSISPERVRTALTGLAHVLNDVQDALDVTATSPVAPRREARKPKDRAAAPDVGDEELADEDASTSNAADDDHDHDHDHQDDDDHDKRHDRAEQRQHDHEPEEQPAHLRDHELGDDHADPRE